MSVKANRIRTRTASVLWLVPMALGPPNALAQALAIADSPTLERVQISATRSPQPSADVPASISVVEGEDYNIDGAGINLSEKLLGVPGILARDRQNFAQDEQISIRGFGSRATFGVRGVRLYLDGIPATMPDGQGQVSHFNLASADRIEVLRGPFSALYGNSSGGVLQIFTGSGRESPQQGIALTYGSFDTLRASAQARGVSGPLAYNLDVTGMRTDGFRTHSAAERISGNAKFDVTLGGESRLAVMLNSISMPEALDPQGLTHAQFAVDPRQSSSGALAFNTRKSVRQAQIGLLFEQHPASALGWRVLAYRGDRAVRQFLSIPVASQSNPLNGGGVVALASPFGGFDLRWSARGCAFGQPLAFVVGFTYDAQDQHRRGYENFVAEALGVQGALRRDEQDHVAAFDQYAQAIWNPAGRWSLFAGIHHSTVRFQSADHFVTEQNPDDSGRLAFAALTPVAGIVWRVSSVAHAYLSYGEGFETPTFDELGYRPDGQGGLNFALQPARSRNGEAGLKLDYPRGLSIDAALFRADTREELAAETSVGGRTTYQNVGDTRREGMELAMTARLGRNARARLAYTFLDAQFRDPFRTCTGTPCAMPTTMVDAGTRIPGVPRSFASGSATWGGAAGWRATLIAQYVGSVSVNNAGTDHANGYSVFDARVGYQHPLGHGLVSAFAGIDNLFDVRYAGSVIVNESNARYFEAAPSRTLLVGIEVRLH